MFERSYLRMISRWMTFGRRRWAYAIGEIVSIVVFSLCCSVLFVEHGYAAGENDPGMARITAGCFIALSAGMFVFSVCLKKIDHE